MKEKTGEHEKDYTDLGRGSFWLFIGLFLGRFLGIVFTMVMTRIFPASEIGKYNLALSTIALLTVFTDFGLTNTIQTYVSNYYGKESYKKIRKLTMLMMAIGMAASIIVFGFIYVFTDIVAGFANNGQIIPVLRVLAVYIILNSLFSLCQSFIMCFRKAKETALSQSVQIISRIALIPVALQFFGSSAISLTMLFLLSFGLGALLILYYFVKTYRQLPESKESADYRSVGREALPFAVTVMGAGIVNTIFSNSDRVLLSRFLPAESATTMIAIYSIALGFGSFLQIFSSAIGGMFVPVVANIHGRDEQDFSKINRLTDTSTKWSLVLTGPLFIFLLLFPSDILGILYSDVFASGGQTLALITLGFFFFTIGYSQKNVFPSVKRADISFNMMVLGLIINVIMNIVLIPQWGITGAAFSFMVFYLVTLIIAMIYSKKLFGFKFGKWLAPYLAIFILLFAVIYPIRQTAIDTITLPLSKMISRGMTTEKIANVLGLGALFLILSGGYLVAVFHLKLLNKNDMELLVAFMKKSRMPGSMISLVGRLPHSED